MSIRCSPAIVLGFAALAALTTPALAQPPRERIGTSLGQPVYRDQLDGGNDAERADSARRLFVAPALDEYFQARREALTPGDAEVAATVRALQARAACEPASGPAMDARTRTFVARYLLGTRGVLRHVHGGFGGGRLLFQQAGVEAFDATRRLIEQLEAQGRLRFDDPAVRALAYDYWTRDHGAFLIDDPARIRAALDAPVVEPCPARAGGDGDAAGAGEPSAPDAAAAVRVLAGAVSPAPGVVSAGRIGAADVPRLREAGVRHVIDLTPDAETPDFDEAAAVRAAGLGYSNLPLRGAQDLTPENARRFDALLRDAPRPLLVHCASANRVGAMAALRAAWLEGAGTEEAIAIGRRWGLKGMEPAVRERLADGADTR